MPLPLTLLTRGRATAAYSMTRYCALAPIGSRTCWCGPTTTSARFAYKSWGWQKVGQVQPFPGRASHGCNGTSADPTDVTGRYRVMVPDVQKVRFNPLLKGRGIVAVFGGIE